HSRLTYGYVFEGSGQRFAYLTDTVGLPPDTEVYLKRQPLDLLVLDCSFPPAAHAPRNHNDLTRALDIVHTLQPMQTVLTHIGHELDVWLMDGANVLPSSVLAAHDGAAFESLAPAVRAT